MTPITRALDLLLPNQCLLCGIQITTTDCICQGCYQDLPWLGTPCQVCSLPLSSPLSSDEVICGHCLTNPPPFNRTVTALVFSYPVDNLIHAFKYQRQLAMGVLLSQILATHLSYAYEDDCWPDLIVPVPLHWRRLLTRGFNQAALVATQLGRAFRLPVMNSCKRQVHTSPQQGATAQQRRQRLAGAFAVQQPVSARHIALVDDVVTTTSTVTEVTKTLMAAGATRVDVWCLARTPQRR